MTAGFLAYPILIGEAQKSSAQTEKQRDNLAIVRNNIIASLFYDTLQARESDWKVKHANQGISDKNSVSLLFEKSGKEITVHIRENASIDEAKTDFWIPAVNQGKVETLDNFGDEGRKIFGHNGFSSLAFRKGKFYVSIISEKDEETAKRFAGYISETISQ